MRVKQVEYDGSKHTFGELTFKQVTDFFGEGKKASPMEVVSAALNNALPPDATQWTKERVIEEMGSIEFELLKNDVLAYSELQLTPALGEAPAAESTSASSAAE